MSLRNWPSQNFLLNAMPQDVVERLSTDLEAIHMPAGQVLSEPGVAMRNVYFPATSIVSKSHVMENGSSAEIALIGREGMVGVPLLLGAVSSTAQANVQSAGLGFRLPARCLMEEFNRGGALMHAVLRYTGFLITQMELTAACNRHGTLDQRLCRWLLMTLDRLPGNELTMTHEVIANALGVKREGVTVAASRLRDQGAIHYRRGHIEVVDRPILERHACECYQASASIPGPCAGRHAGRVPSVVTLPERTRTAMSRRQPSARPSLESAVGQTPSRVGSNGDTLAVGALVYGRTPPPLLA